MQDLISRHAAIDALNGIASDLHARKRLDEEYIASWCAETIEQLPSVQPDHSGDVNGKVDLIDRQAVIDLLKQMRKDGDMVPWEGKDVFARIRKLPSAQPEVTLESAIDYLHSIGWMQKHDKEITDSAYTEGYTYAEGKYRKMWDEMQANIKEKAFGKRKGLIHTADIDAMPTIEPERPSGREVYQAGYAEGYKAGQEERKKMSNKEWVDFLSEQFTVSRTSAREMLHGLMRWKAEDNFKKQFSGGRNEKE